jgi:hypothetical protein
MTNYKPDRVVRLLTALVSFGYFAVWVAAPMLLIAGPVLKVFGGDTRDWEYGLQVQARVRDASAAVNTTWGPAQLSLDQVRADLELPISAMPWWLFAALWLYLALSFILLLSSLHHLRRIFQRARAGAPFDAQNAGRLRTVGMLLLSLTVLGGIAEFVAASAIRDNVVSDLIRVSNGIYFNGPVALISLVLIALAEIFRRGAELENEQSLVI